MRRYYPAFSISLLLMAAMVLMVYQKQEAWLKKVLATASLSLIKSPSQKVPENNGAGDRTLDLDSEESLTSFYSSKKLLSGGRLLGRVGIDVELLTPISPMQLKMIDMETMWLARCIYSETKIPHEQELVAWVVRNRVETAYRGQTTYESVVLDPMQFSAFNEGMPERDFYSNLSIWSKYPGWQKAIRIAYFVRTAAPIQRPFPQHTRHFYSEQSMIGVKHPGWARGHDAVAPLREFELKPERFRFFAGIF